MWRAVQCWEGLETPIGAPFLRAARRLHFGALRAFNAALLSQRAAPPFEGRGPGVVLDPAAPPLADAVWCAREGRAHPVAAAAWAAASGAPFRANLAELDAARAAYVWAGAASSQFGQAIVDTALALSVGALAAWDTLLHRAALRAGQPFTSVYAAGVRYGAEPYPAEDFLDAVALRRRRVCDCEDLTADRVAELRAHGQWARPEFHRRRVPRVLSAGVTSPVTLYHLIPHTPWGLEDPSRALGMTSE